MRVLLLKSLNKNETPDKGLAYFKRLLLEHLDRLKEKARVKKSLLIMSKGGKGLPVGTIREWKGKKYQKQPDGKWKLKGGKGGDRKEAVKDKIAVAESQLDLFSIVTENKDLFSNEKGKPLPVVMDLFGEIQNPAPKKKTPKTKMDKPADTLRDLFSQSMAKPDPIKPLSTSDAPSVKAKPETAGTVYNIMSEQDIEGFQKQSDETWKNISDSEKKYLGDYTDANYVFNEYLKGNDIYKKSPFNAMGYSQSELKAEKNNIDTAIDKFKLQKDVIAFRGTEAWYYKDRKIGETFTEKVYYSTSLKKDKAQDFAKKHKDSVFLEIRVPKGAKCLYIGGNTTVDNEHELLLKRETKYKMIDRKENHIILEVVL